MSGQEREALTVRMSEEAFVEARRQGLILKPISASDKRNLAAKVDAVLKAALAAREERQAQDLVAAGRAVLAHAEYDNLFGHWRFEGKLLRDEDGAADNALFALSDALGTEIFVRDTEREEVARALPVISRLLRQVTSPEGLRADPLKTSCDVRDAVREALEAARAAREDTERPDGQTTALVEVQAEDEIGLVRVQLSLDAPSYLLPVSQARNLGELLIEAADKLTHAEQESER